VGIIALILIVFILLAIIDAKKVLLTQYENDKLRLEEQQL